MRWAANRLSSSAMTGERGLPAENPDFAGVPMLVLPMAINYNFWSSIRDQRSPVSGQLWFSAAMPREK
jgi:hypothetical protein